MRGWPAACRCDSWGRGRWKVVVRRRKWVPGVRPGKSTSEYIAKVLTRVTFVGATFLGFVAVLPFIMIAVTGVQALAIGGTALLIVVSVVLDLVKKVDAQLSMRDY